MRKSLAASQANKSAACRNLVASPASGAMFVSLNVPGVGGQAILRQTARIRSEETARQ